MSDQSKSSLSSLRDRLPSFVWIILILLAIVGVIAAIFGLFYGISMIEGFASVLLLVIGALVAFGASHGKSAPDPNDPSASKGGGGLALALGILFFAAMGLAIDQPGNVFYNMPIQWLFCQPGAVLQRGVDISHTLPGRTDISQNFACVAPGGGARQEVDTLGIMGVRFAEYIVIGYVLVFLGGLYHRLRPRGPAPVGYGEQP